MTKISCSGVKTREQWLDWCAIHLARVQTCELVQITIEGEGAEETALAAWNPFEAELMKKDRTPEEMQRLHTIRATLETDYCRKAGRT